MSIELHPQNSLSPTGCTGEISCLCRHTLHRLSNGMQLLETDPNDPNPGPQWEELRSDNGKFRMVLLKGGNLQLQQGKRVMWESKTHGTGPFTLRMQNDNNLVLYDCKGKTIPGMTAKYS